MFSSEAPSKFQSHCRSKSKKPCSEEQFAIRVEAERFCGGYQCIKTPEQRASLILPMLWGTAAQVVAQDTYQ